MDWQWLLMLCIELLAMLVLLAWPAVARGLGIG